MVKLNELREGDTLVVTDRRVQSCIKKGGKYTVLLPGGNPQVRCAKGTHYLAGDVGTDGNLIGWEKIK